MFSSAKSSSDRKKRVFIAFAIEDETLRDFLVGQAKNNKSPFEFVDMSVKEPYDEQWKTKCRTRIKGCDGVIAMITKNTASSSGAKWEMSCATQENVPMIGVYGYKTDHPAKPAELGNNKVIDWSWEGIKAFIDSL